MASALRRMSVLAVAAAVLFASLLLAFPGHWRVMAIEQALLAPWLRPPFLGDGGPASDLLLCYPMGLAISRRGEILVSDRGRDRRGRVIWRIDADGIAHLVAGSGLRGNASENRATAIRFNKPEGMAIADDGSMYVSDGFNHSILLIRVDGGVQRIAGSGVPGFAGDGGPASAALFHRPADIRLDSKGNLYVADVRNHRVRMIDTDGRIATVAGDGKQGFSPDGVLAAEASLDTPWGIAIDSQDRLIIGDGANHRVRRVGTDGRLVTIAGSGAKGFDGDGGPATAARLNFPEGLNYDREGRLYIGDELNNAIRRIELDGSISTLMGTGTPGRAAIGAPARGAPLDDPEAVIVDPQGNLIVTDGNNGRVLRIADDGIVRLLAGRGDTSRCSSRF